MRTKHTRLMKLQAVPDPFTANDLVFRVMSDGHLPEETDERRRKKSSSGGWVPRTNFPPFQHFVLHDGILVEVGRSHWKGDIESGHFSIMHGKMSNRLASMFLLLVEQYSRRGNFRGYSYVSEMRGQALVQLAQVGLQFDESRSDNPFAWYTQIIKNAFRRILLLEKRNREIRDDLLIMAGALPSFTRQVDEELEQKSGGMSDVHVVGKAYSSDAEGNLIRTEQRKRGRKPKIKEV
jgi:hypothetical protein